MKEEEVAGITRERICSDGLTSLLAEFLDYGQKKKKNSRVSFGEYQFQELWRTENGHQAEISVPLSKLFQLEVQGDVQPGNHAA